MPAPSQNAHQVGCGTIAMPPTMNPTVMTAIADPGHGTARVVLEMLAVPQGLVGTVRQGLVPRGPLFLDAGLKPARPRPLLERLC